MADTWVSDEGALSGTTAKTILAAPASSAEQNVLLEASCYNADTVAHTYTLQKNKASTVTVIEKSGSIASLGTFIFVRRRVVLDATNETLEVVVDANFTTTESRFDAAAIKST